MQPPAMDDRPPTRAGDAERPPPPFPQAPPGIDRLEHPPTIAAAVRYWGAVERQARARGDDRLARIAGGLRRSYEAAWSRLRGGDPD